jgi:transaldolase
LQIFIDSANLKDIEKWTDMGVADGVTTNPSVMLRDGVHDMEKGSKDIAKLIYPRPLSVEVTTDDLDGMLKQARQLARWADNIVIKVPQTTSQGLPCYGVMHELESEGIKVNATAALSIGQVFITAKAEATYISIFSGRVTDEGGDAVEIIGNAVGWLERWEYKSKIIVGSIRSVGDVIQAALAGAHIITIPPQFISKMVDHQNTRATVVQFLNDAKQAEAEIQKGSK